MEERISLATPAELQRLSTIENPVIKWAPITRIDRNKLEDTIEAAFKVALVDDYFSDMCRQGAIVCYEDDYKSVGVVIPSLGNIATLATHPLYRGQHLGEHILREMLTKFGRFNLRSKPEREVANRLYQRVADDSFFLVAVDGIGYNVYWNNHSPFEVVVALTYNAQQPSHFKK